MEVVERYDYRDADGRVRHVVNLLEIAANVPGRRRDARANVLGRAGATRPGQSTPEGDRVRRMWGTR